MSWCISTHDIPAIGDVNRAARHWADQKPWRDEHASRRQLGERRAKHKFINKLSDDRGYEMVLYQTPVVTYYTNGDLALRVYDSASTSQFAWCVCPNYLSTTTHSGAMYWCVPTAQGKVWVRPLTGALQLKFISTGVYEITSQVQQDTTWKLDLKKAAATRKKLSHYDRWQKITSRLSGPRWLGSNYVNNHALKALLEDPEDVKLYGLLSAGLAPVTNFLRDAYELEGARYKVPVPMGELPKRQR